MKESDKYAKLYTQIFLSSLIYNKKKLESIQKPNNRLLTKYGAVL